MIKPDLPSPPPEPDRRPAHVSPLARLAACPPHIWRWSALAVLTLLSAVALLQASVVVNGTRYFWLDDDQMISMRYARNLVDGHGLVWNPGERVEGYSNPLWTLVMAAVHLLPLADAHMAIPVKLLNWGLACVVLLLSERALRHLLPKPGLALLALLLTLAVDLDVVYWSANGFETTLLTALFLLVVVRLLHEWETGHCRPLTYLLLGVLPLVRSDAYHVWAGAALLAWGLSTDRDRTRRWLALSLAVPALHLLARHWYYGEWLPNTYYLKVAGVPGRTRLGAGYLARFARRYCVPLGFAAVGAWRARDRVRWLVWGAAAVSTVYILVVGEDLFEYSRYVAHLVPLLLVLAVTAVTEVTRRSLLAQAGLLLGIFASVWCMVGVSSVGSLDDDNGEPRHGLVTGVLIDRFTRPESTIAVVAAGNTSYFGRRHAIDLLGKCDRHVARLPAHPNGYIGHNKYDPEYSLGLHPDLVVPFWTDKLVIDPFAIEQAAAGGDEYIAAVVSSPIFQRHCKSNPVPVPYLMEHNSVYVCDWSPELSRRTVWQQPEVGE